MDTARPGDGIPRRWDGTRVEMFQPESGRVINETRCLIDRLIKCFSVLLENDANF